MPARLRSVADRVRLPLERLRPGLPPIRLTGHVEDVSAGASNLPSIAPMQPSSRASH